MLGFLKKRVLGPVVAKLFVFSLEAQGEVRGAGTNARALFLGNRLHNHRLAERSFTPGWEVIRERRLPLAGLARGLPSMLAGVDGALCNLPSRVATALDLSSSQLAPFYVRHYLDLSGGWHGLRGRFATRLRATTNDFERKNGLGYRVSRQTEDFDFFFDRMYLPFIPRRHGRYAYVEARTELRRHFNKGFVLFVLQGDEAVAGCLCEVCADTMVFYRAGVLDGDNRYTAERAQTALYYFQIRHALEHGFRWLDLTVSLPFANDGIFQHKQRWGSYWIPNDHDDGQIALLAGRSGPACDAFLARNALQTYEMMAVTAGRPAPILNAAASSPPS